MLPTWLFGCSSQSGTLIGRRSRYVTWPWHRSCCATPVALSRWTRRGSAASASAASAEQAWNRQGCRRIRPLFCKEADAEPLAILRCGSPSTMRPHHPTTPRCCHVSTPSALPECRLLNSKARNGPIACTTINLTCSASSLLLPFSIASTLTGMAATGRGQHG